MISQKVDTIFVVGCGNLGSLLSYYIVLRSLDYSDIKNLILLDMDILEEKNFPYLTMTKTDGINFIGNPKVFALTYILNKIKSSILEIKPIYSSYEKFIFECCKNKEENECYIDCRDVSSSSDQFLLKLACDGPYGKIIYKPLNKKLSNNTRYTIKSSYYYSNLFISKTMDFIFGNIVFKEGTYVFDFTRNSQPRYISNI